MISSFSYGETLFIGGILLSASSIVTFIVGTLIFSYRRKKLKKEMLDEYGF